MTYCKYCETPINNDEQGFYCCDGHLIIELQEEVESLVVGKISLENENKDLKQRNEALENAVIALVDLWAGTEKHRWESLEGDPSDELKDVLIMKWPQVQGLANNNLLRKVAALPFDSKKLIPALKELIGDES